VDEGPVKRILFLTHQNPQGYRIQQYFPYLEERGFSVELLTSGTPFLRLVERIRAADVLYIQRLLVSPLKLHVMRKAVKRIVYDFDDAVMYGAKGASATRSRKFARMVGISDAVFSGNRFLEAEAGAFRQDGLYYVPTVVDTDEYPVKRHESRGRPVVGWIGSRSTLRYLVDMAELMTSLARKGLCSFSVVADRAPGIDIPGMVFRKWEKAREKTLLLGFDAGIMPLTDDVWSRGKCGLKLIQYMASGLPSVAHPVGASLEITEDGVNGFLCRGREEWEARIEELVRDTDLRIRMGRLARQTAEERYSLRIWGPRVAEIIDSL
jgi:glycosyltransferase involved in cell wall biosynthesis